MNLRPTVRITETIYGESAQEGLLAGVKILHDPVASTLGASGRTVIIENIHGNPQPTKDGVTVARNIVPFDSVERMGCEIIKQASTNTADEAGDGTTTSTILAKAIIESGIKSMDNKSVNYTDFNRGMIKAVDFVCEELDKDAKKVNLDNIENVATISANNDAELGGIIASAFKKAGLHGVVLMEKSQTSETFVSVTEGFELEKGYRSEVFVTDTETNRAEHVKAAVLVSNVKIERFNQIEHFAEYAVTNNLPLVIVSEMDEALVAMLAMNASRGKIKMLVVEPTHFGIRRRDILSDLAIATGATLIDEETGDNFDTIDLDQLGFCPQVISDRSKTIFFNEIDESTAAHIAVLKSRIENETNPSEIKFLEERIAKISSSVAVVNVGAASETEQSEKADRVDDAIHAVRAALLEGIIAGGGIALHNVASFSELPKMTKKSEQAGFDCVIEAIKKPLQIILDNGDIEYKAEKFVKKNIGVNTKTGKYGDMFKLKIIDPVKVTKTALRNGVSAASTLLSTTTVIVNLRRA